MNQQIVNPNNARNDVYRQNLEEIEADGKCPFCPMGHTMDDPSEQKKMVHANDSWIVKLNTHQLAGADLHVVLILKDHKLRIGELTEKESSDLVKAVSWLTDEYQIGGGALYMREGNTDRTGATVCHLHAQYVVPSENQNVTVGFGPPPTV